MPVTTSRFASAVAALIGAAATYLISRYATHDPVLGDLIGAAAFAVAALVVPAAAAPVGTIDALRGRHGGTDGRPRAADR